MQVHDTTYHSEGGGIMDNLYSDAEESESDEDVEPTEIQHKTQTKKSNFDIVSIEEQLMEERRSNVDNSDLKEKSGEDDVKEWDSDYDDDEVSDIDEQIEKLTNGTDHLFDIEANRQVKVQTKLEILDSSEESEEGDSDLELIEEDFEDEDEPGKDMQPKEADLPTPAETKENSFDIGKQLSLENVIVSKMMEEETTNEEVKNVDTLINSYLNNLLIKREKWELGRDNKRIKSEDGNSPSPPPTPQYSLARPSPGSPDSGVWSPEPAEEEEGDGEDELGRVSNVPPKEYSGPKLREGVVRPKNGTKGEKNRDRRRKDSCKKCTGCRAPECRVCSNCKDKAKYDFIHPQALGFRTWQVPILGHFLME